MSKRLLMSCTSHLRQALALCLTTCGMLVFALPVSESWAQAKPGAAPGKPQAAAAGASDKAYLAGVKAFESGKVKTAVSSLSSALRQGGLPPDKMAKALYLRGSAYRKQKKPAQAISDLTSAIWIKGGLSDADRLAAMEQRNKAYTEAGLGARAPAGLKPGQSVPSTAAAKPVAVAAPAPSTTTPPTVASGGGTATSAWSTSAQPDTRPIQVAAVPSETKTTAPTSASTPFSSLTPPIAPAPAPSPRLSALPGGSASPTATAPSQISGAPDAVGSTLSTIGNSVSQGVSNVGSFFSNMFSSQSQPSSQVTTSSTTPSPAETPRQQAPAAPSLGWTATQAPATSAQAAKPTRTAALKPTAPAPKPRASAPARFASGKFRLQVAAVRSQQKAQQMVAQLQSKYAAELAGVSPEIDAAAIGNMGTFYRVRLGPYANTKVPQNLCAKLRNDGYDCLIVTP